MPRQIYLDNQSTTPMDPRVLESMIPFYKEKFGNASSIHHNYGIESGDAVEKARKRLAKYIHADSREIIFTSGATEGINLAIKGVGEKYEGKGHIITQVTEHNAVLDTCNTMESKGWEITRLSVDSLGIVNPKHIENAINDRTVLVSIMHANNEIGSIQHIREIGEICKKHKILFFVDACQSFGKLEINVKKMNINLLVGTAHKLYGPKGIGLLYISQKNPKVALEMQIDGGGHERGYRSGTLPVPLIVGFGKAIEICHRSRKVENKRLKKLRDKLFDGIKNEHPDILINGSIERRLVHNLNLCFPELDAETIIMKMKGIACSTGSACSSVNLEPSHVIRAIGRNNELAHSAIRFSVGRFTTDKEINEAILSVNKVINEIKIKRMKRKNKLHN